MISCILQPDLLFPQLMLFILTVVLFLQIQRKEMFYLMMHSSHFIYGYMTLNLW